MLDVLVVEDHADLREEMLEAAIASVMRRRDPTPSRPWRLDLARWQLRTPAGIAIGLSEAEVRLLRPFFEAPASVVDRQLLVERLEIDPRSIDLLVHRLRRKVEAETGVELPLHTVRFRGYAFAALVAF